MTVGILLIVLGIAAFVANRVQARRGLSQLGLAGIVLGVLVTVAASAFIVVPAGRVGVVFSAASGVKPGALDPGYHFIVPGVESVAYYDSRLQEVTLSRQGEGGPDRNEQIPARSKEGLEISADVTVRFKIARGRASELHQKLGPRYIETLVTPEVRSKVRSGIGQFAAADLISVQRTQLERLIDQELRPVFAKNDLELDSVLLRELRIPESVAKAIEEKQTAEQQVAVERNRLQQANIAAQRKVVEAQGESKAAIARAQGEAQALSLRGRALKENPEIIQLTVAEKLSPSIETVLLPSEGNFLLDLGSLAGRASRPTATPAAPAAAPRP